MRIRLILICLCLSFCPAAFALDLDEKGKAAYETLRTATIFAIGGVGITGTLSEQEKALGLLLPRKDAAAAFEALLKDPGTPTGGQLYALLGLKLLEPRLPAPGTKKTEEQLREDDAFRQKVRSYVSSYLSRTTDATVMKGCLLTRRPVSSVAEEIDKGLVRLSLRPLPPRPKPANKPEPGAI